MSRCFILLLLLVVVINKSYSLVNLPPNVSVPAVLVFGDSIVDTGNNNNNFATNARSNFPPYGRDFKEDKATGRFSNGKVPSDLIVEELGIKEFLPPYLDPNLQSSELATGVCFASGGSGYDPLTAQLRSVIGLSGQLELFKEYTEKLKEVVGEERTKFILANSLFLVVFGSSDLSNTYFSYRVRQLQYDVPSYTDFMLNAASKFLKEIYELGARRIAVFNVPPIGCVPFLRTVQGGKARNCVEKVNNAVKLFNSKLIKEIDSLNEELPDTRRNFVYVDIYTPFLDVILNYQKYGYKVANKGCCGTGLVEVAILCNKFDSTCPNDSEYVFWDSFHPTEIIYKSLIAPIISKTILQFE